MAAQHVFFRRAELQDCPPGALVERIGAQLDALGVQRFEGMIEQQQLCRRIDPPAPLTRREPRPANFEAAVLCRDVQIAGAADQRVIRR